MAKNDGINWLGIDWSRIRNGERSDEQNTALSNGKKLASSKLSDDVVEFLDDPVGFLTKKKLRPSFAGYDLLAITRRDNLGGKSLLEQALKKDPGCLSGADFEGCVLRSSNFSGADLRCCNFQQVSIDNAEFEGADLRGADFTGSTSGIFMGIRRAIIDHTTVLPHGFGVDKFLKNGGKIQIDWSQVTLNSTDAQLDYDNPTLLPPTDDIQAFFKDPIAYVMQHETRPSLKQIDLKGIDLKKIAQRNPGIFEGMNFAGADLSGQDLSWMNLKWARLHGAKLQGTNILGTNFYGAAVNGMGVNPWRVMFARGVDEGVRCTHLVTEKQKERTGVFGRPYMAREDDWKMMNLSYVLEALNPFKGR
jgi:uncharacterized protein YjbI with pentapeptide repeats